VPEPVYVTPPGWFLANIWQPAGNRRDKLVLWAEPKPPIMMTGLVPISDRYRQNREWMRYNRSLEQPLLPQTLPAYFQRGVPAGNLAATEYSYWQGSPNPQGTIAVCRFCLQTVYSPEQRRIHKLEALGSTFADRSCARRLQLAYKELSKLRRCIVCHVVTAKHKWGLPLCGSENCEWTWKFAIEASYKDLDFIIGPKEERIVMRASFTERDFR